VDTITGTANNDTISGPLLTVGGTDQITGGAGTDTFNAETNGAVGSTFKMSGVENFNVTNYGAHSVDFTGITGVTTFTQKNGTGAITLNNIADASMVLALEGSTTNSIVANYKSGALSGTSDALTWNLEGASAAALDVDAGFETMTINVNAASSLTTLTAPGISAVTVKGAGKLTLNANPATAFETITATGMTGAIVGNTIDTSGYSSEGFTGSGDGSSILLGSGADNILFTDATTASTKSNTVKLGAGNDTLDATTSGSGANYFFGEAGDDLIRVATLDGDDLVDAGSGTDTVRFVGTNANVVMKGVENVVVSSGATLTINSADQAAAVTARADNNAVQVEGLFKGSSVKVIKNTESASAATNVTVNYASTEAAATVNVDSGMTGALTTNKITNLTVNLGATSNIASAYALTAAESFTLNATGVLSSGAGQNITDAAATDTLKTVSVTGSEATSIGTVTATTLESVSLKATKDTLTYGVIGADATGLKTVTLTASSGAIAGNAAIGQGANNLSALSVTATATGAIDLAAITSLKLGNISVTNTGTGAALDVGAIGAAATELGNVTISSAGAVTLGLIGNATPTLTSVGTISATSTGGKVDFDNIDVKASGGVTVNLTAKTFIDSDGANTAAVVKNTGGNITASLAGAAAATVNFTTATSGVVNLTASNTGGLTTTITNSATAGDNARSTITMGDAVSGTTNSVTLKGTVDNITVNGGAGDDTVAFDSTNAIKSGAFALGAGTNRVDFTNLAANTAGNTDTSSDNGIAVNLSSSTVTFDSGETFASTVASGRAVAYDSTGDENNTSATNTEVVSGGVVFTLTGVNSVVGTARADYVAANSSGSTVNGGAGNDTIAGGAGNDSLIGGSGVDTITLGTGTDTYQFNYAAAVSSGQTDNDSITGFTVGTGGDVLQFGSTHLGGVAWGSGSTLEIGSGTSVQSANDGGIVWISNGAGSAYDTAAEMSGLLNGSMSATTLEAIIIAGSDNAYVWFYDGGLDGVAAISANDFVLIGVLNGVNAGDLVAANFGASVA
jgi:hypothetical protein